MLCTGHILQYHIFYTFTLCFTDYTLWPFYIDRHVDPPFHKNGYLYLVEQLFI